jgi:hypothetical protein
MSRAKNILLAIGVFCGLAAGVMIGLSRFGIGISCFKWAGAPDVEKLKPLIESAWLRHPPSNEADNRSPYYIWGDYYGKAVSAKLLQQRTWQSRWGARPDGTAITYWPISVVIETRYKQSWPSKLRPVREIVTIRERESTCYAFKDHQGWQVTFEKPTDRTPVYKCW